MGFRPPSAFAKISIDLVSNEMQGRPKPGRGLSLYRFPPWPGGISGDPEIFNQGVKGPHKVLMVKIGIRSRDGYLAHYPSLSEPSDKSSRAKILLLHVTGSPEGN